ncbi:EF-hand domain-containing protein [Asticcacaulis sp.]|uniref:EF-hand domain-containing protein n=1 Tax=Asticcacaulis sp. TaxID=1872648 RepID=UPI0031D2B227
MRATLISLALLSVPGAVVAQDVIDPKQKPNFTERTEKMTPAQREAEIKRIFSEFDRNRDGFITEEEAPRLPHTGNDPEAIKADAKFFISLYDDNEDHKVSLDEYRAKAALALIGREKTTQASK